MREHTFIAGARRYAMGQVQGTLFSPDFNRSVVIEAWPERLSSDAGALLIRDFTSRLGLPALAGKHPPDRTRPYTLLTRSASDLLEGTETHRVAIQFNDTRPSSVEV